MYASNCLLPYNGSMNHGSGQKNFTSLPPNIIKPLDSENKKKNFLQILLEVDLFTHMFLLLFIIILVFLYVANENNKAKLNRASLENHIATNSAHIIAAPKLSNESLYINQKVVFIDKKYFNIPEKFILTMNGPIKKEVFGYLPYWMIQNLDDIDTRTLTSVSYFGLEVNGDGQIVNRAQNDGFSPYDTWQNDIKLKNFLTKIKKNKTKIFVTFKSFDNDAIKKIATSPESSQNFIQTILYQVNSHSLDGVNIDFEYSGGVDKEIRDKFSVLMSSLNDALKSQNQNTALTISVYVTAATIPQLWDIPYIANHSDSVVIMGYDFFTPQSSSAGPVAPISGYENSLTGMINNFLEQIPPDKITLAVPYYAYDWTTENQGKNSKAVLGVNASTLSFAEAKDMSQGKNVIWDNDSQTPWYSYVDRVGQIHVVHFENIRSLGAKYDLVNTKNLHGIGIWALGLEGNDTETTQLIIDKFTH